MIHSHSCPSDPQLKAILEEDETVVDGALVDLPFAFLRTAVVASQRFRKEVSRRPRIWWATSSRPSQDVSLT
jgi:hypothetical protein